MSGPTDSLQVKLVLRPPHGAGLVFVKASLDTSTYDVCDVCVCKTFASRLGAVQLADILQTKLDKPAPPGYATGVFAPVLRSSDEAKDASAGAAEPAIWKPRDHEPSSEQVKRALAGTIGHDGRKFLSREPTADQVTAAIYVVGPFAPLIAKFWRAMYDAG